MDALGNPVRFSITEGHRHDITEAASLLAPCAGGNVIADKGYDSNAVADQLCQQGCTVVIPSRKCVKKKRDIDTHLYKERALVECLFQKIKRKRRIATRYEKTAKHFLAMITIACILVWLA